MLIDSLVVLVIAVIGFVIYASRKPDVFRIERSAVIKAAPDKIFAALSDFAAWQKWSPWEAKDPAMARSLSGAAQGVGAHELFWCASAQLVMGLQEEAQDVGHVVQIGVTGRGGEQQGALGQPVARATEEGTRGCHPL